MGREVVLVISDTHFPFHEPKLFDWLSDLKKHYKPTKIVHIGDEVDLAAFSNWGRDPDMMSARDEYRAALKCMKDLYKIFPKVQVCNSNHGSRVYRKSYDAGLPVDIVKSPKQIWEAPAGWSWHDRILIDNVCYIHGDPKCGRNAAFANMRELMISLVQGHTHSHGGVYYVSTPYKKNVFALNVGCLIDTDPKQRAYMYASKMSVKPTIGIGVVFNGEVGQFLPMPL